MRSLVEHDAFLFQKVRFPLDTTSGFINTEQNDTIRRFSILPSMLAPPMLIASIYGMNTEVSAFAHGTTSFVIVSLILVAFFVGPMIYFRWKNGFKQVEAPLSHLRVQTDGKYRRKKAPEGAFYATLNQLQVIFQMAGLNNIQHLCRYGFELRPRASGVWRSQRTSTAKASVPPPAPAATDSPPPET